MVKKFKVPNSATINSNEIVDIVKKLKHNKKSVDKYPDEIKLLAMAMRAQGSTYTHIAKKLNASSTAVHSWCNNIALMNDNYVELKDKVRQNLSTKQYLIGNNILSSITDNDIRKASLLQKTTASSQLIDKARLVDGDSTQNIASIMKIQDDTDGKLSDLEENKMRLEAEIAELEEML